MLLAWVPLMGWMGSGCATPKLAAPSGAQRQPDGSAGRQRPAFSQVKIVNDGLDCNGGERTGFPNGATGAPVVAEAPGGQVFVLASVAQTEHLGIAPTGGQKN